MGTGRAHPSRPRAVHRLPGGWHLPGLGHGASRYAFGDLLRRRQWTDPRNLRRTGVGGDGRANANPGADAPADCDAATDSGADGATSPDTHADATAARGHSSTDPTADAAAARSHAKPSHPDTGSDTGRNGFGSFRRVQPIGVLRGERARLRHALERTSIGCFGLARAIARTGCGWRVGGHGQDRLDRARRHDVGGRSVRARPPVVDQATGVTLPLIRRPARR